ncbi:MAG: NAD(P)/FAD-dependent oxidoreductase [Candidatus ainarchaeum sp.]|nr:NAD(P)/FAD-dependent oxidoreductase [Candidatus ainarchaeum sp.]
MSMITIVGAGPVGLHTAISLKKNGFDVSVIEEHREIGKPVQCAGLISKNGCKELGLNIEEALVNEIKGARLFSPSGVELSIRKKETIAFVVDRYKFDQAFYKKAVKENVPMQLNTKLIDIRKNSLFLESQGHGELKKTDIIVGADGVSSIVRHVVAPEIPQENFVHAYQVRAKGIFNPEMVEVYFDESAKGLFAWIIPENSSTARIGLAVPMNENPADNLKKFIEKKGLVLDILDKSSAMIPIGKPMQNLAFGNILLAGDAGFHTKATTGGGIILGLQAANACSETIMEHIKNRKSLSDYNKKLSKINKELAIHWKIRSYLNGLEKQKIDDFFLKAKKAGIEEFLQEHGDMDNPSRFMGKMLRSPRLWGMLPELLKMV